MPGCSHLDQIAVTELPPEIPGCEDCLTIGSRWLHLRMCLTCGKIGCCDSSPNRHARRHAAAEDHPLVPLTDYNKYKGLCEPILFKYESPHFTTVIIRPATVCAP